MFPSPIHHAFGPIKRAPCPRQIHLHVNTGETGSRLSGLHSLLRLLRKNPMANWSSQEHMIHVFMHTAAGPRGLLTRLSCQRQASAVGRTSCWDILPAQNITFFINIQVSNKKSTFQRNGQCVLSVSPQGPQQRPGLEGVRVVAEACPQGAGFQGSGAFVGQGGAVEPRPQGDAFGA